MSDTTVTAEGVAWRMSSRTVNGSGQCVEAGPFTDGSPRFAVRDSKNRDQRGLTVDATAWSAFVSSIKTSTLT